MYWCRWDLLRSECLSLACIRVSRPGGEARSRRRRSRYDLLRTKQLMQIYWGTRRGNSGLQGRHQDIKLALKLSNSCIGLLTLGLLRNSSAG